MLLEIKNLYFSYNPQKPLFRNLCLEIKEGQIIGLAGESGCGKSTLLSLIYGLLDWQSGQIIFEGIPTFGPKGNLVPGEKDMKLVAQNDELMPYATVYDNVGQFLSNINLSAKKSKVQELLQVVGLEDYATRQVKYLSGGQRQRVAIARALSVMPKLLLLDEPFSNLDFARKLELRHKLFGYVRKYNLSLIISTHELQEVMPWLDKIIILQEGRLIQNDTPEDTYKKPYNTYVASLMGEVNVLSDKDQTALNLERDHYYPHEIYLCDNGRSAKVLESRFAGSYFWNLISVEGIKFIIYSTQLLEGEIFVEFQQML